MLESSTEPQRGEGSPLDSPGVFQIQLNQIS
jgi:hypothetical protein